MKTKPISLFLRLKLKIKKNLCWVLSLFFRKDCYALFGFPRGLICASEISCDKKIIYPQIPLTRNLPNRLETEVYWKFENYKKGHIPDAGVLIVPGGIATHTGGNLSSCGRLITTFLDCVEGHKPKEHPLFHFSSSSFFPNILNIDKEVITLGAGSQGAFYHWMLEVLPRLHLIEKAEISKNYIFADQSFSFQRDSLQCLGFAPDQIIPTQKVKAVRAKKLIIPSIPYDVPPVPWACRFLQEKFLPLVKLPKKKRRLYISRHDASRRRVSNEEEILPLLEAEGYERILLQPLSFLQQIELFASAEKIIAPHGAGLSHLAFCSPRTQLLELFSPAFVNPCYWAICEINDISYTYLFDEGERFPPGVNPCIDPDLIIDVKKLRHALKYAFTD